jgi:hypothetical protein
MITSKVPQIQELPPELLDILATTYHTQKIQSHVFNMYSMAFRNDKLNCFDRSVDTGATFFEKKSTPKILKFIATEEGSRLSTLF